MSYKMGGNLRRPRKDGNIYCYQGVRTISLIEDKMEFINIKAVV